MLASAGLSRMLWRSVRSSAWNVCPQARAAKASPPALPRCARCPGSGGLQHPPAPSFRCRPTSGEATGPPPGQRQALPAPASPTSPKPPTPAGRAALTSSSRRAAELPPVTSCTCAPSAASAGPRLSRKRSLTAGRKHTPAWPLCMLGVVVRAARRAGNRKLGPAEAKTRGTARSTPGVGPLLRLCGLLGVGVSGDNGSIFW